jgi:hypothetical protein
VITRTSGTSTGKSFRLVENEDAVKIIARALKNRKKVLTLWPGTRFLMYSDDGHAILGMFRRHHLSISQLFLHRARNLTNNAQGSPVGATIAYFLSQHKSALGFKAVAEVIVVRDEGGGPNLEPNLSFRIQDTPAPDDDGDISIPDTSWNGLQGRSSKPSQLMLVEMKRTFLMRVHKMWA